MAYGEVYVEVDASVIGGSIMPMATISGNPQPIVGQESFGVWLRWRYDSETGEGGFTGQGWFWGDDNNALTKFFGSEDDFKDWLVKNRPENLDYYLGTWGGAEKSAFFTANQSKLGQGNCFTFVG